MLVDPSVCPQGGTPPGQAGGTPARGVPQPSPTGGYPSQVQMGGTLARSDGGVPEVGYPPSQVRWGVSPLPGDRTADGVLDTPRSVCLLRSRRTFLLSLVYT